MGSLSSRDCRRRRRGSVTGLVVEGAVGDDIVTGDGLWVVQCLNGIVSGIEWTGCSCWERSC